MAVGRRESDEQVEWVMTTDLPKSPGHPFYRKLNGVLRESGFDRFCEQLCAPYYAERMGRPSIPPGVYFRMLLVGYFEGIESQRGIAWRCSDSLALREFLGMKVRQASPDHSSLTVIRKRLPVEVHEQVFAKVLSIAQEKGLLKGGTVAVDATTLEANAAMKSIVRKDSGEDWKEYVGKLAKEAGLENPTAEELRRFDRKRKGKKVSNDDWQSPSDPDSRIAKMKDGDTHLAYKAEHAVDLKTEMVVAAQVYHADQADSETLIETLYAAQENLREPTPWPTASRRSFARTFRSRRGSAGRGGANGKDNRRRSTPIGDDVRGNAGNGSSAGAANGWNGVLRTCARRVERDEVGFAASWR